MIETNIKYMWYYKDGNKGACSPTLQIFDKVNDATQYGIIHKFKKTEYYLMRILTTTIYDSNGDILMQSIAKDRIKY